ncbi:MAG TPA: hypothetical protein VK540_29845 [Polyangiaceae bacterium]|nr:hypothetical protein [Polyangiaceae bacterium]
MGRSLVSRTLLVDGRRKITVVVAYALLFGACSGRQISDDAADAEVDSSRQDASGDRVDSSGDGQRGGSGGASGAGSAGTGGAGDVGTSGAGGATVGGASGNGGASGSGGAGGSSAGTSGSGGASGGASGSAGASGSGGASGAGTSGSGGTAGGADVDGGDAAGGGAGASGASGGGGASGRAGASGSGGSSGAAGADGGTRDVLADMGGACCGHDGCSRRPDAGDASRGDADAGDSDADGDVGAGDVGGETCDGGTCRIRFVAAPNRRDVVYDAKRQLLYITTNTGTPSEAGSTGAVLRWDVQSSAFLSPLLTGGTFNGIDISPNDDTLVVAESGNDATNNWVHVVDLPSGTSEKSKFPLDYGEGGTFMPLFLDDTTLLVSSEYQGSGWAPLRKATLGGSISILASIRQDSMLARSGDGRTIAIAESNISNGPASRYNVPCAEFLDTVETQRWNYEICVSRDGSQMSVPTYDGTYVYDIGGTQIKTVGAYAADQPVGCAYSPIADIVYFAWVGAQHPSVEAYRTDSLERVKVVDPQVGQVAQVYNTAFVSGRTRISRDGTRLLVTVNGGVALYALGAGGL